MGLLKKMIIHNKKSIHEKSVNGTVRKVEKAIFNVSAGNVIKPGLKALENALIGVGILVNYIGTNSSLKNLDQDQFQKNYEKWFRNANKSTGFVTITASGNNAFKLEIYDHRTATNFNKQDVRSRILLCLKLNKYQCKDMLEIGEKVLFFRDKGSPRIN